MSANALADHVQDLLATLQDFMKEHVYPNESVFEEHQKSEDCWKPHPLMEQLKVFTNNTFIDGGSVVDPWIYSVAKLAMVTGHAMLINLHLNC
jgi:hypothetical protein